MVTNKAGSTCYCHVNVLGFRGGEEMRQHNDEFIHKKGRRQFDEETQQKLDHGMAIEVI